MSKQRLMLSASNMPTPSHTPSYSEPTSAILLPAFTLIENITPAAVPLLISEYINHAPTSKSPLGPITLPRSLPLIPYVPFFRLPLAPRKSFAGFIAGSATGAAIAIGFWGFCYPVRDAQLAFHLPTPETLAVVSDVIPEGVSYALEASVEWLRNVDLPLGRWIGLTTLGVVSGLISGTAEALGTSHHSATLSLL